MINSICDSIDVAIIITDSKGIIQGLNSAARKMIDIEKGDQISEYIDVNNIANNDKVIQIKTIRVHTSCRQFSIIQRRIDDRMLFIFEPVDDQVKSDECADVVNGTAPYIFNDIIGLDNIKQQAVDIAEIDCNVLITGETGTGKELIASAIHNASPRASNRYITVNCSAIPDALFESELFGHKKGAFTDARIDRMGLIEYADGGTLLLDEIGEMPSTLQPKLLRALESRRIRPLGYDREKIVNVRFIFSTNSDLSGKVKSGLFREDLYHRIKPITIRLPTLKDRSTEIPALICKFLMDCQKKYNKGHKVITDCAIARLMQYNFPGNVRELEGVIHRAYILCRNNKIDAVDLFLPEITTSSWDDVKNKALRLKADFVKRLFLSNNCDVHKTCNALGLSAKQVMRYMKY